MASRCGLIAIASVFGHFLELLAFPLLLILVRCEIPALVNFIDPEVYVISLLPKLPSHHRISFFYYNGVHPYLSGLDSAMVCPEGQLKMLGVIYRPKLVWKNQSFRRIVLV